MTEIVWIDLPEFLAIHARQLDEHGGAPGLRDSDLLESALARPRQHHAHGNSDVFDLTAAYTATIIANHPFVDGNKRTAFVAGVLFLELNGPSLTASEEDVTQAMLDLTAGEFSEDQFAMWLRTNSTMARDPSLC